MDDSKLAHQSEKEEIPSQTAEDVVNDLIRKATQSQKEGSSDEEYLSAEEEGDDDENSEVIRSIKEVTEDEDHTGEHVGSSSIDEKNKEDDKEEEDKEEEETTVDEMEERKKEEDSLTEEEKMDRKEQGQKYKDNGNDVFRKGDFDEAITEYTRALDICPLHFHKERAIMFANRATCKMKKEDYEAAIEDSTHAIELHPQYVKAILRRAELFEKTEKLDEALKDYETVVQLDPNQNMAKAACMRLQEEIKERNEKMKAEMMGKLKDLGNLVLRPFGLSTNNFKLQQDPNTGSYSMQFQQNPTGNGS